MKRKKHKKKQPTFNSYDYALSFNFCDLNEKIRLYHILDKAWAWAWPLSAEDNSTELQTCMMEQDVLTPLETAKKLAKYELYRTKKQDVKK